jgi:LEA14-like dessication related protein
MPTTAIARPPLYLLVFVALTTLLPACGSLRPGYETPTVTISSFRSVPSQGTLPTFEIGLSVINPNPDSLRLRGISYTVSLNERELIKGVSNELPVIEAYGEGEVILTATPNLIQGIRFVTDLMNGPGDSVSYALEAKLDVGSLWPPIRVADRGTISLGR